MKKVLIPFDGSETALAAVRLAGQRHFADGGMEIHLLHVSQPLPKAIGGYFSRTELDRYYREEADKSLQAGIAVLTRFGAPTQVHHVRGDKAESIDRMARKLGVDEIIIGTRRKSGLTRLLESSVTQRLMAITNTPVEVVASGSETAAEKYGLPAGFGAALALLVAASE